MTQKHPIIWTTKVEHYDISTGDLLTKRQAEKNYYVIKTDKKIQINANQTKGVKLIYKTCILKPQLTLEL